MPDPLFLPLDSPHATLALAGGKGANLVRLVHGGFSVPGGFILTTMAYAAFVEANHLAPQIAAALAGMDPTNPAALQRASETLRGAFGGGAIPREVAIPLREAYAALEGGPVAVRSSATTEDLPELSFAGQQDTFLNVRGEAALLEAVVACWSSLWTARAIGYRARNGIPHEGVRLAVVVQRMVASEASGVLFTANPLNGKRTETVIDATLGLGEALVSGLVEPDHYVVDPVKRIISSKTLGAKALAIEGRAGGGVEKREIAGALVQALPDAQILALAGLGQQVSARFGFPQDIEWAWAGGQLWLLQARPVTSLYPLPEGVAPEPLRVFGSFGAVQGMLAPMTPLGRDVIGQFFAGGAGLFGVSVTEKSQNLFFSAGERLWMEMTGVLQNTVGRRVVLIALAMIEPGIGRLMGHLLADPRLAQKLGRPHPKTLWRLARFARWVLPQVLLAMRNPDARRAHINRTIQAEIDRLHALHTQADASFSRRAGLILELKRAFPAVLAPVGGGIVTGFAQIRIINMLLDGLPGYSAPTAADVMKLTLELTRGLPHNVTTEMDLALWETARAIQKHPALAANFLAASPAGLAESWLAHELPAPVQTAADGFLTRYGMRGVAEIDIGRPRWRDDPTQIMQTLQSYLRIEDESMAPDAVFRRGEQVAEAAIEKIAADLRKAPHGKVKEKVFRGAARRFRALAGLRESPKFTIVRLMGIVREGLLASGRELVEAGALHEPADLFFLTIEELRICAEAWERGENLHAWQETIAHRRAAYQRELNRRQIPRLLLSDGETFYEGLGTTPEGASPEGDRVIRGSPVSPGVVEGVVRVVFDPAGTQLAPGEILVCPGTDPAWTPLFLAAGGLVMEVGGLMTHGSVVAREYGIPAVVGVHQATSRLATGQRVRVDGSAGTIEVL